MLLNTHTEMLWVMYYTRDRNNIALLSITEVMGLEVVPALLSAINVVI